MLGEAVVAGRPNARGAVHGLLLALLLACVAPATAAEMHVFYGDGCPHCAEQHGFLDALQSTYPELVIHRYEVWRQPTHHGLFLRMAEAHGIDAGSVPTVFMQGRAWVGHSPHIAAEIEAAVRQASAGQAGDPVRGAEGASVQLPLLGGIDLSRYSLLPATVLIAVVDGFNPCSFWVLTLLLGLVVHSGSRRRVALVGVAFLLTTTLVYGAFIAGVFGVLSFVLYLHWVRWMVAGFALLFGLVNVKDYFWYRRGLSFTIAEQHKPGIYRGMRRVLANAGSAWALLAATVAMALGIALVELPCTAGFPVLWSSLVAEQAVDAATFAGLLALYLLIYLLDEAIVFVVAVATLRIGRFEERHGRLLKLIGGLVMLALAVALFGWPELLNRFDGTLLLFAAAIAAALLVHLLAARRASPD